MLNPFPDLLDFRFFAPTLLRLAAAGVFFYLAYATFRRKEVLAAVSLPFIGAGQKWVPWLVTLVEFLIGLMFFTGFYTQIAAILGIAAAVKYWVYGKFFPQSVRVFVPLSSGVMLLLAVISLSLLLTGAGAYAFDIPL